MSPQTVDVMVRIACGLLAAATMVFIFLPSKNTERAADKTRVSYLYERKDVVYENLRDLNFEFKSGKFTQDDFGQNARSRQVHSRRLRPDAPEYGS